MNGGKALERHEFFTLFFRIAYMCMVVSVKLILISAKLLRVALWHNLFVNIGHLSCT